MGVTPGKEAVEALMVGRRNRKPEHCHMCNDCQHWRAIRTSGRHSRLQIPPTVVRSTLDPAGRRLSSGLPESGQWLMLATNGGVSEWVFRQNQTVAGTNHGAVRRPLRRGGPEGLCPDARTRPIDMDTVEALEEALIYPGGRRRGRDRPDRRAGGPPSSSRAVTRCRALVSSGDSRNLRGADTAAPRTSAPHVVMAAMNGTGKADIGYLGKLGAPVQGCGKGAADLRCGHVSAAAVEQLEVWANRAGVDIILARTGADLPAGGLRCHCRGQGPNRDVVIVDTGDGCVRGST